MHFQHSFAKHPTFILEISIFWKQKNKNNQSKLGAQPVLIGKHVSFLLDISLQFLL